MTDKCWMCGKFLSEDWRSEDDLGCSLCGRCIKVLNAEMEEADIGIGNGQACRADQEYCRHYIKRVIIV
jgi:hypothetical protein